MGKKKRKTQRGKGGIYSVEVKRWLRAIGIAECLFEDEGYHAIYLNQMADFIRREKMYSPKIKEEYIPELFRMALSKKIPMTKLVNRIIKDYLETNGEIEAKGNLREERVVSWEVILPHGQILTVSHQQAFQAQ